MEGKQENSSRQIGETSVPLDVMVLLSRPLLLAAVRPLSVSSRAPLELPPLPTWPPAAEIVARAPLSAQKYLRLMRADKPTGTMLLYWPGAWSIALAAPAGAAPSLSLLALFGAGAFAMRSAGCVINDLWDRDYDRQVERTRSRPLASGEVTTPQAVALLAGLLSTSLGILCTLSTQSILVGASSMVLVVGYPLAKRYTDWPQVVLGATLNWGVLIAWAHLMPPEQWWKVLPLYAATCLHTFIYDTVYAHQDKKDDARVGVRSTALHLGERTRSVLGGCTAAMLTSLILGGLATDQTWPYYAAAAATYAHVGWQVATVRTDDPDDCWAKFRSNTWLGALLLAGIISGNFLKEDKKKPT
ncbi:coq-2 [Pristionchus pacificus]|uniref:4-hydroxybenzoate polyprenyltransferase, mitochondrial n=1 Tax=Pristionchus pacificus TaxID=54126 RepID=A0A2A6CDJ4_PRIPA|nr:coq-2 [Pristionchus pacificus]|eukprot:PDM76113.1 coq-2 [Pristionchus pacificus]